MPAIDHPVIAVRDMDGARLKYQRLGFIIPGRGRHREWGTGNWCIMFPDDYLELRGILDPRYPGGLDQVLQRGEGLMGVALATTDAAASHRELSRQGLHPRDVHQLTRDFELPNQTLQPRFSLCFLDESETAGLMSVVFCQHLTPELIRRPEWMQHPNGVTGVRALEAVVPDLDAAAAIYEKIFGASAVRRDASRLVIEAARSHTITVSRAAGPAALVTLAVGGLGQTQHHFATAGVRFTADHGTLTIPPQETCGVLMHFAE